MTAGSADDELEGSVVDVLEMSPPPVTPPPKKKPKQTVEEAAAKILTCMATKADVKVSMKRLAAAISPTPTPKPKPAKKLAEVSVGGARPSVSIEKSRSQVLYRSGLKGPGQSKVFKYTDAASKAKALREAKNMAEVESKRRRL